jgi:hypothetical protein
MPRDALPRNGPTHPGTDKVVGNMQLPLDLRLGVHGRTPWAARGLLLNDSSMPVSDAQAGAICRISYAIGS